MKPGWLKRQLEQCTEDMKNRPKVGIGVLIRRDNKVLLHKRKSEHGYGTWAFPGGHLEMFEDFDEAILREMAEECGPDLKVENIHFWTASNTIFYSEDKHYVVIFMLADWVSGEAKVMEPDKCECWEWFGWDELPEPLMLGVQDLVRRGLNPLNI